MKEKLFSILIVVLAAGSLHAQETTATTGNYKKRVLETSEVDFLMSYYSQDGDNAAVTGGKGTEDLQDIAPTFIVSVPLNDDDVLTVEAGISAYTSASSSNINPFDGSKPANPFQASSGASSSDVWAHAAGTYSHSSDDRNQTWTGKLSLSSEFDYFSLGFGGSYTRLFNQKNTELSLSANVFRDQWTKLYPYELRPFVAGGDGINASFFEHYTITGNSNYNPKFDGLDGKNRNSYSAGIVFTQILSKRMQAAFLADWVLQKGLLSTPFQRVYFSDYADSFIEEFHLADDVERLPDSRQKIALGTRLNYYLNEHFTLRGYYRYYTDDWGINAHTASLEIPFKLNDKFTLYPSYRYYTQTAADYFAGYNQHLSTEQYYSSDYDLSKFQANQYGFGIRYTDLFTEKHIWKLKMKSLDLKYHYYERNSGFKAHLISFGIGFVL
ncbi:DUF3570 domain-containing protein [Mangrovibacterium marinum]|uniref:Uncharacterized protein DUF3570 n=1 Tax=Mangrovibacterium marinum TaxID=1639118 RepID=A0A2T5C4I5_9BACT|nr:DUF3570 domain-containing protein [Mangrovibacterium marinum]PTN09769.1 uncharacterized protein DUF3570 [Mangrovibacterium marinum]